MKKFIIVLCLIISQHVAAQYYYGVDAGWSVEEMYNIKTHDSKIGAGHYLFGLFVGYQHDLSRYGEEWKFVMENGGNYNSGVNYQSTVGLKYKTLQITAGTNITIVGKRVFDVDTYYPKILVKTKFYYYKNLAIGVAYSNKRGYVTLYGGQFLAR